MSGDPLRDEEGFRVFYEGTSPRLLAYARRLLGPGGGAEEVVQEAYLRFLERRPAGLDARRARAWVYTTATRLARERWRRRAWSRRRMGAVPTSGGAGQSAPEDGTAGAAPDPGANLDVDLDLERALRRLSVRERALLWLAYAEGRTHREIASILELRPGSVRVLLFRARRKLEGIFKEMGLTKEDEP